MEDVIKCQSCGENVTEETAYICPACGRDCLEDDYDSEEGD